jgi:hypothetical protein
LRLRIRAAIREEVRGAFSSSASLRGRDIGLLSLLFFFSHARTQPTPLTVRLFVGFDIAFFSLSLFWGGGACAVGTC